MTDARDDQDIAEALDDDQLAGDFPPEKPMGVDAYGVTPGEERWDEPLDERVRREVPEGGEADDRGIGALVDPDEGGGPDTERDAVAELADRERDETLGDVATELEAPPSAEESAMHLTTPPPMGDGDGYVEEEADRPPPGAY